MKNNNYEVTEIVTNATQPDLRNAWGIELINSQLWVTATASNKLFAFDIAGVKLREFNVAGGPTGIVDNPRDVAGAPVLYGVTQSGSIYSVNLTTDPPGVTVHILADPNRVYTGVTIINDILYAANFHSGFVDRYSLATDIPVPISSLENRDAPRGYNPFNVANISNKLFVAYAKKAENSDDEVTGKGRGIIFVYTPSDTTTTRFANKWSRLICGGALNAPWAMIRAPGCFGKFSDSLLVGNFGDGKINSYDFCGKFLGTLTEININKCRRDLVIDGLWGLVSDNVNASLYYAAGPNDETDGVLGKITFVRTYCNDNTYPSSNYNRNKNYKKNKYCDDVDDNYGDNSEDDGYVDDN